MAKLGQAASPRPGLASVPRYWRPTRGTRRYYGSTPLVRPDRESAGNVVEAATIIPSA